MNSLYLDLQYLNLISFRFDRLVKKGETTYNLRCPLCKDSKRSESKARGYFFNYKQSLRFKCHNCGESLTFADLLKQMDPAVFKNYLKERYKSDHNTVFVKEIPKDAFKSNPFAHKVYKEDPTSVVPMTSVAELDDDHYCKHYVADRLIPEKFWTSLYFIEHTKDLAKFAPDKYTERLAKMTEPRLVFPFYSDTGKLVGLSGRALNDNPKRYISIKDDEEAVMIYGVDRFDRNKKGYAVEGPIDSLFLPNCIAVSGTAFAKLDLIAEKDRMTLVFDNQPRNPEVCYLIRKKVEEGYDVCIWPEYLEDKDINDMILNGATSETVQAMIDDCTYSGEKALLKYNDWRKC